MPVLRSCDTDGIDIFTPDDIAEVVVDIHVCTTSTLLFIVAQHTILGRQTPGRVDITDRKDLDIREADERRQVIVIGHFASANHPDSDPIAWRRVATTSKDRCMHHCWKAGDDTGCPCEKALTGNRCV